MKKKKITSEIFENKNKKNIFLLLVFFSDTNSNLFSGKFCHPEFSGFVLRF